VILGPLLVSVAFFAALSPVLRALLVWILVIIGMCAVGALLLLVFNISYYHWLAQRKP
jgi:hypothetical protein